MCEAIAWYVCKNYSGSAMHGKTEEVLLIHTMLWKPTAELDYNLCLLLTMTMIKMSRCLHNIRTDHQRLSLFDAYRIATKQSIYFITHLDESRSK